ncbi:hypothetical protein C8J57DRAFT_1519327 [Mycena rebaudengoi]|nr:hypothetical protein C8J57DRAFT_1519327 [Mycena rebaudengoi]
MRVPQEIADKIIDNVADTSRPLDFIRQFAHWQSKSSSDALKACALAARSFLPSSRRHFFAAISCRSHPELTKFDRLLRESPHHHVVETKEILPRILLLLPNLTHVGVNAVPSRIYRFQVTDSNEGVIQKMFSFRSLRSVCLIDLEFTDVWELESLLSHATGLKELILVGVRFHWHHTVSVRAVDRPHEYRVILESVRLESMAYAVDLIAANFTIVDVHHLHYLEVIGAPLVPLLTASAQTIREVRNANSNGWKVDQDILEGNTTLHSIEINDVSSNMASTLKEFGHLGHLTALKTISLHFTDTLIFDDISDKLVDWRELDETMAQAGVGLEDVRISNYPDTGSRPELALVRERLPSVAGKISIHKYSTS